MAEFVDRVIDAVELEGRVPGEDLLRELAGARQHVAVEGEKIRFGNVSSPHLLEHRHTNRAAALAAPGRASLSLADG